MGETSLKVISALALILGVSAFGWLAYDQLFIPQTSSSRQYYETDTTIHAMPSGSAYYANLNLAIEFTVNAGEKVYFSYVSNTGIDDGSAPTSQMYFYFKVDGVILTNPNCHIWRYNDDDGDADGRRFSVTLQHYNATMPPGQHNVTVTFWGDSTGDSVRQQTLFVQIFK